MFNNRPLVHLLFVASAMLVACGMPARQSGLIPETNLKTDENVILFPTNARFLEASSAWELDLHGWVFEPESDSIWRNGLITSLAKIVGIDKHTPEKNLFDARVRMFLVDNERNKNIVIQAEDRYFRSPATSANGHFSFRIVLNTGKQGCQDGFNLRIHTQKNDWRDFRGYMQCISNTGVSVISDIDDTIKISNVLDKKKLLKNTFTKTFRAVPGMPAVYKKWKQQGRVFHYVSSSPWQLFPALDEFMQTNSYPRGSMHLKLVRLKDTSFFNLFSSPKNGKIPTITSLLKAWPQRKFVLVGDSGEKDPDIYAHIAREYPDQILKIYIRDVRNNRVAVEKIFDGLPREKWQVFSDANKII